MSDGLYKSLEEATGTSTEQVNKEIAHMTVTEVSTHMLCFSTDFSIW